MKAKHVTANDTVPSSRTHLVPPPMRNPYVMGYRVCSHSGEFMPAAVDCTFACRRSSFQFARFYRVSDVLNLAGN